MVNRPLIVCFICSLLFCFTDALSQEKILTDTIYQAKIDYNLHDSRYRKDPAIIHFIKITSESLNKDPYKSNYSCTLSYRLISTKTNDSVITANISFKKEKCSGDTYFKDFDLSEYLFPNLTSFEINILSNNEHITYSKEPIQLRFAPEGSTDTGVIVRNDCGTCSFEIRLQDMKLYHDKYAIENFDSKIMQINNYYVSNSIIDTALRIIDRCDLAHSVGLPKTLINYFVSKNIIDHLRANNLIDSIGIKNHDPVNFMNRYRILILRHDLLGKELKTRFANYHPKLSCVKVSRLVGQLIDFNLGFYNLSKKSDFLSSPVYYEFGKVKITNSLLAEYINLLKVIPAFEEHKGMMALTLTRLTNIYYRLCLFKADSLINEGSYDEARDLLITAGDLCNHYSCSGYSEAIFQRMARAVFGMFDFYILLSEKSMLTGNTPLAEDYLDKAAAIQKENSKYIISDEAWRNGYKSICNFYLFQAFTSLAKCDTSGASPSFDKAQYINGIIKDSLIDQRIKEGLAIVKNSEYSNLVKKITICLDSSDYLCAERQCLQARIYYDLNKKYISIANQHDSLQWEIKKLGYDMFITQAAREIECHQYELALEDLIQANKIALQYRPGHDTRYDTLMMNAGKPLILQKLSIARMHIWGNEPEKSKTIFTECNELTHMYLLNNDPEITSALDELKEMIIRTICSNNEWKYNKQIIDARESIRNKNFGDIDIILKRAFKIIQDNPDCHIPDDSAKALLNKYSPAIFFTTLTDSLTSVFSGSDCRKAIFMYYRFETYYLEENITSFGINLLSLIELLEKYGNTEMLKCSAKEMINHDDLRKALIILIILKDKPIPEKELKEMELSIGKALGVEDRRLNPEIKPEVRIKDYLKDNKEFHVFEKAYIKAWNQ